MAKEEISLSFEESNKLRAKLGLPPLRPDPPAGGSSSASGRAGGGAGDGASDATAAAAAAAAPKEDTDEVRRRLERLREKRLLKEMGAGGRSGSSAGGGDGDDDAAAWVARMRQRAKEQAARQAQKYDEEDEGDDDDDDESAAAAVRAYTGAVGGRVLHKADEFAEGEEVILTLKDSNILDDTGEAIADDVLELENANMVERQKGLRNQRVRRMGKGEYRGYADADVGGDLDDMEVDAANPLLRRAKVLKKYDSEHEDEGMVIGSGGAVDDETEARRARKQAEIRAKLLGAGIKPVQMDRMDAQQRKAAADYYTRDEMVQFKSKKKKKRKKKKKQRMTRKRDASLADELLAPLPHGHELAGAGSDATDHGTRELVGAQRDAERIREQLAKERSFRRAIERAEERSRLVAKADADDDDAGGEAEKDHELEQSLLRARLAAQRRGGARSIAAIAQRAKAETREDAEGEAAGGGGGLVFTSTTEFVRHLDPAVAEARREEEQRRKETTATATEDVAPAAASRRRLREEDDAEESPSKRMRVSGPGVDVDMDTAPAEQYEAQEEEAQEAQEEEEAEEEGTLVEEPLASGGLADVLRLARERKLLRKEAELHGGRARDEQPIDTSDIGSRVKLEYKNDEGEEISAKEAFRMMSWRFHGHGPGRKKIEQRARQKQQRLEARKRTTNFENTLSMKALRHQQNVTGQAHVVLGGSDVGHSSGRRKKR